MGVGEGTRIPAARREEGAEDDEDEDEVGKRRGKGGVGR